MKKMFLLSILLFMLGYTFAQDISQTVRGIVIDQDAGSPLPGATIIVEGSEPLIGAVSDLEGKFRLINVPVGRQTFTASFIGYEQVTLSNIYVGAAKELVLTIEMVESIKNLDGVVIRPDVDKSNPKNDMATVSARNFSVEETRRYAASISDPARMALNFAGVTSGDDLENEIIIRGNSPKGLLWRVEGMEIPNPNHFGDDGAAGGAIGMISNNVLTNSDFFTGAFPAEYGNALSGVFDLSLRNGNNEKREYTLQAGLLGLEGALEGPFIKGDDASYLVNFRYSTLAMFDLLGIHIVGDAVPTFGDLAFKINIPGSKLGTLSLFGIGGGNRVEPEEGSDWKFIEEEKMGVIGVRHNYSINNKTYLRSVIAVSATNSYDQDFSLDYGNYQFYKRQVEDFSKHWIRYTSFINRKINARHTLKTGFIYTYNGFHGIVDEIIDTTRNLTNVADIKGSTSYFQAYTSWKYRIGKNLTMNTGLHYLFYELSNKSSLEPRLGITWDFMPKHSLSIAAGIHGKFESLANHLTLVPDMNNPQIFTQPNKHIGFTKAYHLVAGYDYKISKNMRLKLEGYYQYLYDVPVVKDDSNYFSLLNTSGGYVNFALSNEGTGKNYGIELTFDRFFADDYYIMFTASVFESTYKGSDGIERNTRFNNNYVFNLLGGKEFSIGTRNLFGVNLKSTLAGGNRYIPIDMENTRLLGYVVHYYNEAYNSRVSDYFRIDVQLNYRWNLSNTSHELRFDIQNVTNRLNIKEIQYNWDKQDKEYITHLGILPLISYRLEF